MQSPESRDRKMSLRTAVRLLLLRISWAGCSAWGQDDVPALFTVIPLWKPWNSVFSQNMTQWMTMSTLQSPLQVDWHTESVISVRMSPYTGSVFTLESRGELVFGIFPTLVTLILCRWVVVKLLCGRDPTLITPNLFRYYVQIFQFDDVISDSFRVFLFLFILEIPALVEARKMTLTLLKSISFQIHYWKAGKPDTKGA